VAKEETIHFKTETLPAFTERGFQPILERVCSVLEKQELQRIEYLDLLDPTPNPMHWFRAISSPYVISGRPEAGSDRAVVKRASDCFVAYLKYWLEEIVAKAEPMKDPAHKEYVNKRKAKIRDEFRRKDPGGPPLVMTLGKELAWEAVKLIF
jgi:hypothetical protein